METGADGFSFTYGLESHLNLKTENYSIFWTGARGEGVGKKRATLRGRKFCVQV